MITAALFTLIGLVAIVESSTIPPATTDQGGCIYHGTWYPDGHFKPNPCQPCMCHAGTVNCAVVDCFVTPCVDAIRTSDQCCPVCPNGPNCRAPDGQVIPAGKRVWINDHTFCSCGHHVGNFMTSNDANCVVTP